MSKPLNDLLRQWHECLTIKFKDMKLKTSFLMFGNNYELFLDTEKIDRNYDDEWYSYWIVVRNGHYFEVNIWKDDDNNYTTNGVVYGFKNYYNFVEAGDYDDRAEIVYLIV